MTDVDKGSYVRWQGITITQFGYATNLLLGMAMGALAFTAHLLVSPEVDFDATSRNFLVAASLAMLVSSGSGVSCVITRLYDFRCTAEAARSGEKDQDKGQRDEFRTAYRKLGTWSWRLFWGQTVGLAAGALLLVISGHVSCPLGGRRLHQPPRFPHPEPP